MKTGKFDLSGMTCSACVAHVEKSVRKLEGVEDVTVNLLTNSMSVHYNQDALSVDKIIESVQDAGYDAFEKPESSTNSAPKVNHAKAEQLEMKKRVVKSFIFLIPLLFISMGPMFNMPLPAFLTGEKNALTFALTQLLLTVPVYIINRKFFSNGFRSLWKLTPTMDSLVAIGSSAALLYGIFAVYRISYGIFSNDSATVHQYLHELFFESGATILTLITLGKYIETRSKRQTSDALTKLINSAPQTANVIRNKQEIEIPVDEVRLYDIVSIRPGEKIAVDGIVETGFSSAENDFV